MAKSLFKSMHGFLPTLSYNKRMRDLLDRLYPKAIQWCSSDPEPIYTIFDDIRKFNDNHLREDGEFYIDEIVIEIFGQKIRLENGFYHCSLINYLLTKGLIKRDSIKYFLP